MQILVIPFALMAAVSWGTADFCGGLASRGMSAVRVVLATQTIGVVALVVLGVALQQPIPGSGDLLKGAVAGLAGGAGLLLLYLSLARDKMGLAAPLTAIASGGVPLLVGMITQGLPSAPQMAGFLLALIAIWIISRPEGNQPFRLSNVVLPLISGIGFGIFMALIGLIDDATGFVWPLVATRIASISLMAALVLAGWARERGQATNNLERPPFPWKLAIISGLGDTIGNALFVLASQMGRLDVASVLGALYPAATVLLAWLVLGERLSKKQSAGVGVALAAVALIAL